MIRQDRRDLVRKAARAAASLGGEELWRALRLLMPPTGKGGKVHPLPMLDDRQGNPIHDAEGRADRWFERVTEIEAGRETTVAEFHHLSIADA